MGVPWQEVAVLVFIVMVGVTEGFTVMVKILLFAVDELTHGALLVKIHFTSELFVRLLEVNVLEFVPTLTPLTCH